ncbi:hypothetical protein Peetri_00072 [Pseudomonas phage vB_PpuM-Peetri]
MALAAKKKIRLKRRPRDKAEQPPVESTKAAVRNIVGVCNHNPYQVGQLLPSEPAVMGMDGKVSGSRKAQYLLVPYVATLLQFRDTVLAFKGTVIVFDDPVKLDHVLQISNVLDIVTKNHSYQYTFGPLTSAKLVAADEPRRPIVIDQERINVLPNMINAVQGSIAQVIMEATQSLIPTVKSDVLKTIFSWISESDLTTDLLLQELVKLNVEDPEVMMAPLLAFLGTEQGEKTCKAFAMVAEYKAKNKSVPYPKIEKATGVPSFDLQFAIRYIRRTTAVRRPGMTLSQIHAARRLKSNNDILVGIDDPEDEEDA